MAENPPPPRRDTGGISQPPVVYQQRPGIVAELSGRVTDTLATLPPTLLIIVLLNIAFAGVGGFYLLKVEEYRSHEREALSELLSKCLTESVPLKYLMDRKP